MPTRPAKGLAATAIDEILSESGTSKGSFFADHVSATYEGAFMMARAMNDRELMRRQLELVRRQVAILFDVPAWYSEGIPSVAGRPPPVRRAARRGGSRARSAVHA